MCTRVSKYRLLPLRRLHTHAACYMPYFCAPVWSLGNRDAAVRLRARPDCMHQARRRTLCLRSCPQARGPCTRQCCACRPEKGARRQCCACSGRHPEDRCRGHYLLPSALRTGYMSWYMPSIPEAEATVATHTHTANATKARRAVVAAMYICQCKALF